MDPEAMKSEPEPDAETGVETEAETGAAESSGPHVAGDSPTAVGGTPSADDSPPAGDSGDGHDPAGDGDTADRERRLRDLVAEAGFAGTFAAMAGIARRWSEHPEVDPRAAAELRLLGRRLDALVQDVGTSTRLS